MSGYEIKPDSGRIFQNFEKRSSRSPDYTGTALIGGRLYYVSAWHNPPGASRGGEPGKASFGLKFTDKAAADAERTRPGSGGSQKPQERRADPEGPRPGRLPLDDEIPF